MIMFRIHKLLPSENTKEVGKNEAYELKFCVASRINNLPLAGTMKNNDTATGHLCCFFGNAELFNANLHLFYSS